MLKMGWILGESSMHGEGSREARSVGVALAKKRSKLRIANNTGGCWRGLERVGMLAAQR